MESYFLNSWAEPGFSVLFEFFQSSQIFLFNVLFLKRVDVIMFNKAALKC